MKAQLPEQGPALGGLRADRTAPQERRLLQWLYAATVLLLLLVMFFLFRNLQRYDAANEGIRRSNVILIELQGVLFALKDAEAGSRGYILTHDTTFLRPFNTARPAVMSSINRLDSMVVDGIDRARVDTLRALAADIFRRIQGQLILERTSGPGVQGGEVVRLLEVRRVMERIRDNRLRMVREIEHSREQYYPEATLTNWKAPLMLWVYFGMALLATALLLWRLLRALRRMQEAEEEVQRKVVELDREARTREFAERSLRRVLDSSANAIMAFRSIRDERGRIVDLECILLNRASAQYLGLPVARIFGERLSALPGLPSFLPELVDVVESGMLLDAERASTLPGIAWVDIHAVRLLDGVVITIADASDRKREQNDRMESDRLAVTGRIARTIAHEVRNPLTNLRMALEQLVEELDTGTREQADPFIDILQRNMGRIDRLITDLLESSKPRDLDLKPTAVEGVLEAALATVSDRLALQQMEGRVSVAPALPRVNLDARMMTMALTNICINAVEAMEPGKGRLEIEALLQDGDLCILARDNGRGVAPENIQRLFEAFYSGRNGGMGLGLTTVRSIVNAHGARLSVDSGPGAGTTFIITFPSRSLLPA